MLPMLSPMLPFDSPRAVRRALHALRTLVRRAPAPGTPVRPRPAMGEPLASTALAVADVRVLGTWRGRVHATELTLTLQQRDSVLTGQGRIDSGEACLPLRITGSAARTWLTLTFTAPDYQPMRFVGTATATELRGHLDGSGLERAPVMLHRA
jgi:hypothetical protein